MLDTLLDQEGLEVDPVDRMEADIPLHKAVRFVNGLAEDGWEAGAGLVELLLDAGADPRSVPTLSFFFPFFFFFFRAVGFLGGWFGESGWTLGQACMGFNNDYEANVLFFLRRPNRIRNKAKLKPFELVDPRNTELRSTLQKAEFAMMAGDDVVGRDGEDEQGPTGSASDSE